MQPGQRASVSAARWLAGVMAAVVLSFVLDTIVTEHLQGAIASRANELVSNVVPSVRLLTNALGDLDRVDFDLDQYVVAPADARPALSEHILAEQLHIDELAASYAELPAFPDEVEPAAKMRTELHALDASVADLVSNDHPDTVTDVHRKLDTLQQTLRGMVEFDATQGERIGLEIVRIRAETTGVVAVLDVLSVALAFVAAILAIRQLRHSVGGLEVARQAGELREAELASRAEALGNFAGRVAHDILSPLATALMALQVVRPATEDDPREHRAIERGIAAVKRVQTLVDGLLAFSSAGGRPEPGASTKIAPVIADVSDELALQAKQQRILLEVGPIADGTIACSAGVLTSLVSNLVRNALRYMGDTQTRHVQVRVVDVGACWRIEVEDTGPGIPVEQQERIFEPYVQLGRRGTGIGLGLATVDRLVRAHGGRLGVISPPEGGALFWFELPKAIEAPEPQPLLSILPAT